MGEARRIKRVRISPGFADGAQYIRQPDWSVRATEAQRTDHRLHHSRQLCEAMTSTEFAGRGEQPIPVGAHPHQVEQMALSRSVGAANQANRARSTARKVGEYIALDHA
jgi:G:T/U-mismatch repair DNA glycosylase